MDGWKNWEIAVLAVAAYIAITALVRLMARRRDHLLDELSQQVEAESQKQEIIRRRERKRQFREQMRKQQEKDVA